MFREMRRARQALSREECEDILRRGTSGVLAVTGDGGWPYAVPLSYCYRDGKLWFHCARAGHKLDALRREPRASFCVVGQDLVSPAEYTTHYRSVIAFGVVRELEGKEKRAAIEALAVKYAPGDSPEQRAQAIRREEGALCMLELEVAHLTGKQAKELLPK